jgi:hypothetical protein
MFVPHGDYWLVRFRGGQIYPVSNHKRGLDHIYTLLQHPGDLISTDALTSIANGQPVAQDALQISLDADEETIASVNQAKRRLEEELEEAEEFCHYDEVDRIKTEIKKLGEYLAKETRREGKAGREPKVVKKSRDRVSKAIKQAITGIKQHSPLLAAHLTNEIDHGRFMSYRRTGIAWDLEPRNDS